jgi:hypothetical protein
MNPQDITQSPALEGMAAAQPAGRFGRLMEAWFGRSVAQLPAGEPFRDSDFEPDTGFFGEPLGGH